MKLPEIPKNEAERLTSLYSLNLLDSLPEEDFDNITSIASLIFGTPISTITLIDANRQFFKSKIGLADNETARSLAFCAHAINDPGQLMIVPDSREDARFFDNPFVVNHPFVVFYAGMPLVMPDGFAIGTLCVIDNKPREVTEEQKHALKCLAMQVVRLFELRQKNELLQAAQKELSKYAQEMEAFAYVASHDLQEPLRMVKSFVQLLDSKYASSIDAKGKLYINFALDGANRMGILIRDLLDYSRAGRTDDATEDTDLNDIMEEVLRLHKLTIIQKQASIDTTPLPEINIPRTGILQVFQNLIGNALKYCAADRKPVIKIKSSHTNTHWQFSVSDNGIGILPGDLEAVFTVFKRLHTKEDYPGTGLGLAICRKIVLRYGGEIWAESTIGSGSSFHFTLLK